MSEIQEAVIVDCPYAQATGYLDSYLTQLEHDADGMPLLRLQARLADLGIPGDLTVERDAIAKFAVLPDPHQIDHSIAVSWAPAGGGPFPRFAGFLVLSADAHYGTSRLALEGDYGPPLGVVGKAFDVTIGRKIARATARRLLATLQAHIEKAYAGATERI